MPNFIRTLWVIMSASKVTPLLIIILIISSCAGNFENERQELSAEFVNYIELTNAGNFEAAMEYLPSDIYSQEQKTEEANYSQSFLDKPEISDFKIKSEYNIDTIISDGKSIFSRISYSSVMTGDMSFLQDSTGSLENIYNQVKRDKEFFGEENVEFNTETLTSKITINDFLYARKDEEGVWSIFSNNDLTSSIIPKEIKKLPITQ